MPSKSQIEIAKATKQNIVNDLCNTIDLQRQTHEGWAPIGFVAGLIKSHLSVWPWLTRNTLNNELRRCKTLGSQLFLSTDASLGKTSVTDTSVATPRTKGGRPAGTTNVKKKNSEMAIIAAKKEISLQYHTDKKWAGKNDWNEDILRNYFHVWMWWTAWATTLIYLRYVFVKDLRGLDYSLRITRQDQFLHFVRLKWSLFKSSYKW